MELAPPQALVPRNGEVVAVPAGELRVGDAFIVKPGQSVATDCEIQIGASSVDQALTGESVPVEKGPGDAVFARSINGEGALEVLAAKSFADNTISRIIRTVEEAQERKGRSQRFIERPGGRYSRGVSRRSPPRPIRAPGSSREPRSLWPPPRALVIPFPITLVASLGTAARQGVLITGGIYLEKLAKVSVVAMDKTDPLTWGEPEVTDVLLLPERVQGQLFSDQILLGLPAGIERRSNHPLAQAIVRHAEE